MERRFNPLLKSLSSFQKQTQMNPVHPQHFTAAPLLWGFTANTSTPSLFRGYHDFESIKYLYVEKNSIPRLSKCLIPTDDSLEATLLKVTWGKVKGRLNIFIIPQHIFLKWPNLKVDWLYILEHLRNCSLMVPRKPEKIGTKQGDTFWLWV